MPRKSTRSYAGRQVDLEAMLPDYVGAEYVPGRVQGLAPAFLPDFETDSDQPGGRILAGVEKVAQRYARLFLTAIGSCKANPERGSEVARAVMAGYVSSSSELARLCALANANAVMAMRADDADPAYGEVPADERLATARVESVGYEKDSSTPWAGATVRIVTEAGEGCEFTVPVYSGIAT